MSEWRLVYAFKKLPTKRKKDMQVKIFKKKTAKVYKIRHRYANAHLFYGTPWLTISAKQTTRILNFYQTTKHTTGDNV